MKTKSDFLYEKESYAIIGGAYDVQNSLGSGHKESFYQKALAKYFSDNNIPHKEQLQARMVYRGKEIGLYRLDFLVFDKIVVEIKNRNHFSKQDIRQLYAYLKATHFKLGILIHFGRDKVYIKRVINLENNPS
jgi:GxxExxY protein